ncbi:MAG: ATP-binding protein [Nitrospira sp.]|nr:ATP-binding protein [Nitrospira sp.]
MTFPRTLSRFAMEASRVFPVLLVTGARQVGKTTLLQELREPDRGYITLDDPLVLRLAREDPALFLQRFKPPVLIDEIQYAPELLPHIKMAVDGAHRPGMFWLTGSQPFHLMQGVSESLAGRVAVVQLLGFSRREAEGKGQEAGPPFLPTEVDLNARRATATPLDIQEMYELIWRGSFPAMTANPQMGRDLFYGSYVQTYVQRDVRNLARVGDEMAFLRFLRAAAARTGQLLNMAELARDADVVPNTAKSWLSILEASGLVYLLQPWHSNVTKRLVKTPKLYFLDTGLCAYLTQWSSPQTLEAGAMSGAIFETWVVVELLKSYWHQGRQAPFYYYRDKDQREIDLLIERDGVLYPVEIKKSASPDRDALRHMAALERRGVACAPGAVICMAPHMLPLSRGVTAVPVGSL